MWQSKPSPLYGMNIIDQPRIVLQMHKKLNPRNGKSEKQRFWSWEGFNHFGPLKKEMRVTSKNAHATTEQLLCNFGQADNNKKIYIY